MATMTDTNLKITGSKEGIASFLEYVDFNEPELIPNGKLLLFEAWTEYNKDVDESATVYGQCKWSIFPLISKKETKGVHPTLKALAKKCKVEVLINSEAYEDFQEFYWTDGKKEKYIESDFTVRYTDDSCDEIKEITGLLFPPFGHDYDAKKYKLDKSKWI